MKRTLLITLEYPPQVGGVASFYGQLAEHLPADRFVVMAPQAPEDSHFDATNHARVIRQPLLNELLRPGWKARAALRSLTGKVSQLVKQEKIELLLVGNILPLGTLALWLKARQTLPYLTFTHGLDVLRPQRSLRKRFLIKAIVAHAKGHIVNSGFTKHELIRLGVPAEKIHIVRPGPSVAHRLIADQQLQTLRHRFGLENKSVLLTVGRLVARKGHDVVLRALPAVLARRPDVMYLIVGSGPEQEKLERLTQQLGLTSHVTFCGAVPSVGLPQFYQLCDIFVMPARQIKHDVEGFGIVYLEANSFGKPVLGGLSGGVPEAIQDGVTGQLLDPLAPKVWSDAILNILKDEAYAHRLGLQGMDWVHREFDWASRAQLVKEALR